MDMEQALRILTEFSNMLAYQQEGAINGELVRQAVDRLLYMFKTPEPHQVRIHWHSSDLPVLWCSAPFGLVSVPLSPTETNTIFRFPHREDAAVTCGSIAATLWYQGYGHIMRHALDLAEQDKIPSNHKNKRPLDDQGLQFPWPEGASFGKGE